MELFKHLTSFFRKKETPAPVPVPEPETPPVADFMQTVAVIHAESHTHYAKGDLVYFPAINAYGAFRFPVVKEILNNSDEIGISVLHLELNNIYFREDEKRHQYHKKTAINHLDFLSKNLQYADNDFTRGLFGYLAERFPENEVFELNERLIQPLVFINVLYEFGFLETFPEFDFRAENFSLEHAIAEISGFLSAKEKLFFYLKAHLDAGGSLPSGMAAFVADLDTHGDIDLNDLPRFFASMIFSALESTIGFVGSLAYTVFVQYPELAAQPDPKRLYAIANEVLRIHSPIPFVYRNVTRDTQYLGTDLKKGDLLILFLAAANLDETCFPEPHKIRLDRSEKHLAFGRGQYACIGDRKSVV